MKEEIFEVPQNERREVNESSGAVEGSKGVANKWTQIHWGAGTGGEERG